MSETEIPVSGYCGAHGFWLTRYQKCPGCEILFLSSTVDNLKAERAGLGAEIDRLHEIAVEVMAERDDLAAKFLHGRCSGDHPRTLRARVVEAERKADLAQAECAEMRKTLTETLEDICEKYHDSESFETCTTTRCKEGRAVLVGNPGQALLDMERQHAMHLRSCYCEAHIANLERKLLEARREEHVAVCDECRDIREHTYPETPPRICERLADLDRQLTEMPIRYKENED